jgi:hypothetical protein
MVIGGMCGVEDIAIREMTMLWMIDTYETNIFRGPLVEQCA